MFDPEWMSAEKEIDPDFEGSLFQKLGYEARLCPTCKAHLYDGICLNTCHLSKVSQKRFASLFNHAAQLSVQPTASREGESESETSDRARGG